MFARVAHAAALGAASLVLSNSAAAFEAPAAAQEQPKNSAASGSKNQRYCETITMTGSRLAKKKFCGTRAEWEDKRLQDRKTVEQFQTLQCMYNRNDPHGRPTC
jgi:hypothetical protein